MNLKFSDTPNIERSAFAEATADNLSGGVEGIRTLDPSVANAVLSQLSYHPNN